MKVGIDSCLVSLVGNPEDFASFRILGLGAGAETFDADHLAGILGAVNIPRLAGNGAGVRDISRSRRWCGGRSDRRSGGCSPWNGRWRKRPRNLWGYRQALIHSRCGGQVRRRSSVRGWRNGAWINPGGSSLGCRVRINRQRSGSGGNGFNVTAVLLAVTWRRLIQAPAATTCKRPGLRRGILTGGQSDGGEGKKDGES